MPAVSQRRACRVLSVSRSSMYPRVRRPAEPQVNEVLAKRLKLLIGDYPTYGYRRLWALLRFRDGVKVKEGSVPGAEDQRLAGQPAEYVAEAAGPGTTERGE